VPKLAERNEHARLRYSHRATIESEKIPFSKTLPIPSLTFIAIMNLAGLRTLHRCKT